MNYKEEGFILNLENFVIVEDNEETDSDNYYSSQILKKARLERHMTLSESANGICSVSYLSKLENQQIKPDKGCVKALEELYGLNIDEQEVFKTQKMVDRILELYANEKYQIICEMFESINHETFSVHKSIIKCFYYLIKNEFKAFKKEIRELNIIKNSFRKNEKIILVILVNEYNIKMHSIVEMKEYFDLFDNVEINNYYMKLFLKEQEFIYGYHTLNMSRIFKNLSFFDGSLKFPIKKFYNLKLMQLEIQSRDNFKSVYEELNSENFEFLIDKISIDFLYSKYLILINNKKYMEIIEDMFNRNIFFDSKFIGMLAFCVYKTKNEYYKDKLKMIIENHEYDECDGVHKNFIKLMLMIINNEDSQVVFDYIKYDLLPKNKRYAHYFYNHVYDDLYIEALANGSKYKEALYYFLKHYGFIHK